MQVQHEPMTINHVHVDGRGWAFNLEDELHTRFTGTSIDLMPIVLIRVAFADGDAYTWHKARPLSASASSRVLSWYPRSSAGSDSR